MFVATHPFLPLDVLRVPHRVDRTGDDGPMGFARIAVDGGDRQG